MTCKEQEDRQIIKYLRHWLQWCNDMLCYYSTNSSMLEVYHNKKCVRLLPSFHQNQINMLHHKPQIPYAVSKYAFKKSPGSSPHNVGPKIPRTVAVRQLTSSLVKDTTSLILNDIGFLLFVHYMQEPVTLKITQPHS